MPAPADTPRLRDITELLERLHRHKDAAYGDAWRKRGEVIAIFANMARKYDRLCVYAGKYLTWIAEEHPADLDAADLPLPSAAIIAARIGPDALRAVLVAVPAAVGQLPTQSDLAWAGVRETFDELEAALMAQATPGSPADQLLDFTAKARLAWALTSESAILLACLERDDPATLDSLRDEVAAMERTAARP
jgi:hypothetical protein